MEESLMEESLMEESLMTEQPSEEEGYLSGSYRPGYSLESEISARKIETKVAARHVESELESFKYESLLQERFSDDEMEFGKKASFAKLLVNKSRLKEAIVLSEILKPKF